MSLLSSGKVITMRIHRFHFSLGRADKELQRLQSQLDRQMHKMQRSVNEAEADYQVHL